MATRKIVPRADNEGGLGTALKRWASAFINALTANAVTISDATASLAVFTDANKLLVSKSNVNLAILVGNLLFPVGSIYTSISPTNPGTSLGFGTWAAFAAGKVLVGLDGTQTEFDVVEETGGAKTHALSEAELASHLHHADTAYKDTAVLHGHTTAPGYFAHGLSVVERDGVYHEETAIKVTGGGTAHNNLQPYVVVYMWKRTA